MTQPVLSLWINGKAQASTSSRTAEIYNPATGQVIRRTPLAGKQDVNLAVAAARAAFPGWRDTTPLRRARILMRFRELMQEHRDELVHLSCEEHGKTREDAAGSLQRGIEVIEPLWMFPVSIACGNSFILKPSEKVPSASLRMAELFHEAGLPAGVFNVIPGDKEAVDALLTHPDVRAVSFVGSTPVAKYIYETAARHGKRVQ